MTTTPSGPAALEAIDAKSSRDLASAPPSRRRLSEALLRLVGALSIALVLLLTANTSIARAGTVTTTLPPAVASVGWGLGGYDFNADYVYALQSSKSGAPGLVSQFTLPNAQATAAATGSPAGGVSAYAWTSGDPGYQYNLYSADAYGSAELTYYVAVNGPPNVVVPLNISGTVSGSYNILSYPSIGSYESVTVDSASIVVESPYGVVLPPYGTYNGTYSNGCLITIACSWVTTFSQTLNVTSDTPIPVTLYALADAGANYDLHANVCDSCVTSSSASVDPVFSIDPSFSQANEFSIVLSAGIGNSEVAAPAPTAGTGLLAFALLASMALASKWGGSKTRSREQNKTPWVG